MGQSLVDIYAIENNRISPGLGVVYTYFTRVLLHLAVESANELKVLTVGGNNALSTRGEQIQKRIPVAERKVLDICKLSPLGESGAPNLLEEVSLYQSNLLESRGVGIGGFRKKLKYILFYDYLLNTSLCFVEKFTDNGKVDKFYATRNRHLAVALAGESPEMAEKYTDYLEPYSGVYKNKQLTILKMNSLKAGWSITKPRKAVDFGGNIKVTPVFLTKLFLNGLYPVLKGNLVQFTFIKDNLAVRELVGTLSQEILSVYYGEDRARMLLGRHEQNMKRGYIKLPEVGLSRHDETGIRALNVNRIVGVKLVVGVDTKFLDVHFDKILPAFTKAIEQSGDKDYLRKIARLMSIEVDVSTSTNQTLKVAILNKTRTGYTMGTTTYLKRLHSFMLANKNLFPHY